MPFHKPKVPEYPRPVPSICTDEIPLCEDTVVYEDRRANDTDSDDEEAAKRAAKRRRTIERCAHAYLRGDPVFILSASLKGPFERGWKNPWKKNRPTNNGKNAKWKSGEVVMMETAEMEVPQTDAREAKRETAQQRFAVSDKKKEEAVEATPCAVFERDNSVTSGIQDVNRKSVTGHQPPASARRVEDWLKTNNAYTNRRSPDKNTSPTPITKIHDIRAEVEVAPRRILFGSKPSPLDVAAHQEIRAARLAEPVHVSSAAENDSRAEFAILQNKRRSTHTVPPSTTLPAFEYRRGGHQARKKRNGGSLRHFQTQLTAATGFPLEPEVRGPLECTNNEAKSTSKPTLLTETSKESTSNILPSAQIAPAARLEAAASTIASIGNMLEVSEAVPDPPLSITQPAGAQSFGPEADQHQLNARDPNMTDADQPPATAVAVTKTPNPRGLPTKELDTQEMVGAIAPFDLSTIKKSTTNWVAAETPVPVTKVKPSHARKRASFVVDQITSVQPQGSIKTTMKVKKTMSEPEPGSPKPSKYGKLDLDMETSDEGDVQCPTKDAGHRSFTSMLSTKKTLTPKGILKSSTVISSLAIPIPSTNTGSTSMKQDAQRVAEPHMEIPAASLVPEDDNFDLSAAIDDLGSYLGTWDPEKEASGIMLSAGV